MRDSVSPRNRRVQSHALYIGAATLLLWVLFTQVVTSIPRLSITFDEDFHIAAGYSVWRTGDWRMIWDNPSLIKLWMSWPQLLSPYVPHPQDVTGWAEGTLDPFAHNQAWRSIAIDAWVVPARITITWLAVLLGAVLFRWASDWFGPRGGLLALLLFAFDPNILTHAALATLDLGVTCFIFVAMYALQRCLFRRVKWSDWIVAGIALGLALTAKISGLILVPISAGLILLQVSRLRQRRLVIALAVYWAIAFLTLWAVHGFEVGRLPGLDVSVPARAYWRTLQTVSRAATEGVWAHLLGETYRGGRWYYFPIVFALKTSLPVLLLAGATIWVTGRQLAQDRQRIIWREITLASLPVSFFIASMVNAINIGYRHLLPIVPFIYLAVARLFVEPRRGEQPQSGNLRLTCRGVVLKPSAILLALLVLWHIVGTVRIWPFHLTFFNEIAGGPRNGYRYLADSNVDWGQALKALRAYLDARHLTNVRLSSFMPFIRPELYGIQATPLPPLPRAPQVLPARFNPASGTYVISASTLRGLMLADRNMYNWFWHREPDDVVANAMLVYQVVERVPRPTWVAQCTMPVPPMEPEQVAEGFGRNDLRLAYFDCGQSWFYPTGGKSPGWTVLPDNTPAWTRQYLEQTRLSFEQKRHTSIPPFRIYEVEDRMAHPQGGRVRIAPSTAALAQAVTAAPVDLPVSFWGDSAQAGLILLGYRLDRSALKPGETVILETAWRVESVPGRLLSLMAHALGSDGRAWVVGDGLGVPIESWQVGDVFVQRHTLSFPADVPPGIYWIQTGVYWLDDGERWSVRDGDTPGDRVLLVPIEVQR